ncbi:MAG: UDP-N-acetylglucosamine--N-acetylmuramyl-(pentapeptide) pyrophosphoryl-undecaprenol N-acetylglucosamine transferase [Anaerolineae bacterium]|nr:UDP-N-acetylglucosamine--N-acetylmuramyl-(pentapeptide) pyrophosphoryl-undecaprenol N-acetylglucosamine transferase [Anaerolineae bacterium]
MKLVISGGGTGGHIYPALAVVEQLQAAGVTTDQILWIGTRGQMEEKLVPQAGLRLATIDGGPIAGVPIRDKAMNAGRLGRGLVQANRLLREFRPNVLFLTGGYVNVPVALVARTRRIPAAVYLPDVEPGAAIKRISRWVDKIGCTADGSQRYFKPGQVVVTGYPVRTELRQALSLSRVEARQALGVDVNRPNLFVFGGSRGAQSINRALMAILPELLIDAEVVHVSGTLTWDEVDENAQTLAPELRAHYHPYPYLRAEMALAFRSADLIVARAGASMLGEGPAFGVPAILVPYPHAWRYQKVNADYLAERGAAIRLNDDMLQKDLLPTVRQLLFDDRRLAAMAQAAWKLDRPQAAADLAQLLQLLVT